ncbi:recombinase family protein [Ancylobacter terrae]|uniref:recombinase family protein n=1 Tax=Ancylobacter sp. sgz301288 TaxID=3342077 RepID=UPI00385C7781
MAEGTFVAYYRVSTDRQGRSGLGLEAQQKAVRDWLNGGAWTLAGEFVEAESGKDDERPELRSAIAMCKRRKAKLVIAKLDRLSRNLAFVAALMDSGVEFVAVDNPHANKLTLHILAAVAQHEREQIAERTKAALAASKARGTRLGKHGADVLAPRLRAEAAERAQPLGPVFAELAELSTRQAAAELNRRGIPTPTGGTWLPMQVSRTRKRLTG